MKMLRKAILLLLAVVLLLPLGCVDQKSSASVLPVSDDLLTAIASGEESGVGMTPGKGCAVKSKDFSNVYMVAMEFSATGIENQIGVWATNSLTPGDGLIMAVDGLAKQFTVWPDADETEAGITITDDGVEAAKAALVE